MSIDEKKLREFGEGSKTLSELKNIKMSEKTRDNIWNNIDNIMKLEKKESYNVFIDYRMYLAIAVVFILGVSTLLFNEKKNNTLLSEVVKIKIGGTITPSKKAEFNVVKASENEELISLKKGELDIYVIPAKKAERTKRFEVQTKDGKIIVKGTKFKVKINKNGTNVSVKKGKVWVEPVGKGRERVILTKGLSTQVKPLSVFLKESKENGIKAYKNKNYKDAKIMLNKYILNKTKDYQVITILARISEHQNNYKNAIKLYKKVLNSKSSLERQTAWIAIAVLLKNNNENSKSKKMFLNYLKTFPNGVFRKDVHKELRSR